MLIFVIWLVVGAITGWLASVITGADTHQGVLINIMAGIAGAYAGSNLFLPYVPDGPMRTYLAAIIGSLFTLGLVTLVRRVRAG